MLPLSVLKSALRRVELPDPMTLWSEVLRVAITSNPYPLVVQIRALINLRTADYADMMAMADEFVSQKYETAGEHYLYHQFAALVRKYPFPSNALGINPVDVAKAKFYGAEEACRLSNDRVQARLESGCDPHAPAVKHMRDYILFVLKDTPDVQRIIESCDFTPGAAIGLHGNATNLARKLCADRWTVNPSALPLATAAFMRNPHVVEYLLRQMPGSTNAAGILCWDTQKVAQHLREKWSVVSYDKISFVLKDNGSARTIGIQPLASSYVQKGIDVNMRSLLRRVGLDLRNQVLNQDMAYYGSLGGDDPYCTIDLTSASDMISTRVVQDLLPPLWFELLDSARCKYYQEDGVLHKAHKFVSMGNGFCFPLQTLIFASVCAAAHTIHATPHDFRVYGDDMVVRKHVFATVMLLLEYLGFVANKRKTFWEGPFRESCGTDWFAGANVRPIFMTSPLDSWGRIHDLHNASLRREAHVQQYFAHVRNFLFKVVPESVRLLSHVDPRSTTWEGGPDTVMGDDPDRNVWDGETTDGTLWVPHDVFLCGKYVGWNINTQSWRYASLRTSAVVDPDHRPYPRSSEKGATGEQPRDPFYFLIGALRGSSSSTPFALRYETQTRPVIVNDYV